MNALGVDISERSTRAVLLDEHGTVLRHAHRDLTDPGSIAAAVREAAGSTAPAASGFVVAGDRDDRDNVQAAVGPNAVAATAANAIVIAETWIGAARGAQHVVCLWVGERVFAGIMLDGRPWSGAHGLAGSAGWLALNPVERQDYRKFGSLAAEVSNRGIAHRLSWRIQAGDHSSVLERAGDLDAITAAHVFEGARAGDGVSISVVRDTAKYIGMAAATLAAAVDPEVVVLGGTAAAAADLLFEAVRQEFHRRVPPEMSEKVRFEVSPLGEDGAAVGAARIASLARR